MTDKKMAALDVLGRHFSGFEEYPAVLHMLGDLGHGRVAMQQWQVVFSHILILRRKIVQAAGMSFHDLEVQANKAVKNAKILTEPQIHWMLVLAHNTKIATGDSSVWDDLQAIL